MNPPSPDDFASPDYSEPFWMLDIRIATRKIEHLRAVRKRLAQLEVRDNDSEAHPGNEG